MPRIAYKRQKISARKMALISQAIGIIDEYQSQGYDVTLRQLYYQFVSRGLIANQQSEYTRLGAAVDTGRLNGLIDWDTIVDRTRGSVQNQHWNSPSEIIKDACKAYGIDRWVGQRFHVEVWIEKEALAGVIEGVCRKWDVPFLACRGYLSQSEMWRSSQRMVQKHKEGQSTILLHLGDHDPSGIDMTRDIEDRLAMFVGHHTGEKIMVVRLALNMEQIQLYNPPPNPAKLTDSRCMEYLRIHGQYSWELDALEPRVLVGLVEQEIKKYIDMKTWKRRVGIEDEHRASLQNIVDNLGGQNGQ